MENKENKDLKEMNKDEYMDYKMNYLETLKHELQGVLDNMYFKHNFTEKKFNDLLLKQVTSMYHSLKCLAYFPEYELPKQ